MTDQETDQQTDDVGSNPHTESNEAPEEGSDTPDDGSVEELPPDIGPFAEAFNPMDVPEGFRSGFVALIGRPNAGKSTLLNALMGTKVSITTRKPQTTRNRIRAVHTEEGVAQVVYVDTPGIHLWQEKKLNERMVDAALAALADADVAVMLVDATRCFDGQGEISKLDKYILEQLEQTKKRTKTPVILVVNKLDLLDEPELALPIIDKFTDAWDFDQVVGTSALKEKNVDTVKEAVIERLPEGPMLYPPDIFIDEAERFVAAEMIREQITKLTRKEIPYAVAVEVTQFKDDSEKDLLRIGAIIHVERNSQKGIIIGKRGSMLKKIGTRARKEIERFFGRKVFLETFVRVQKEWSQDPKSLDRFGYREE